jgi:hypothetical protein
MDIAALNEVNAHCFHYRVNRRESDLFLAQTQCIEIVVQSPPAAAAGLINLGTALQRHSGN